VCGGVAYLTLLNVLLALKEVTSLLCSKYEKMYCDCDDLFFLVKIELVSLHKRRFASQTIEIIREPPLWEVAIFVIMKSFYCNSLISILGLFTSE